jgi:hypothetical protein
MNWLPDFMGLSTSPIKFKILKNSPAVNYFTAPVVDF